MLRFKTSLGIWRSRSPDVDGDGVSELLVTTSVIGGGRWEQDARLYSAKGGKIRLLNEAQGTYVDTCSSIDPPRGVTAQVLRYRVAPARLAQELERLEHSQATSRESFSSRGADDLASRK